MIRKCAFGEKALEEFLIEKRLIVDRCRHAPTHGFFLEHGSFGVVRTADHGGRKRYVLDDIMQMRASDIPCALRQWLSKRLGSLHHVGLETGECAEEVARISIVVETRRESCVRTLTDLSEVGERIEQ